MAKQTVYRNGRVFTADAANPWAEGFVVEDGRFAMVGSEEELEAFVRAGNGETARTEKAAVRPGPGAEMEPEPKHDAEPEPKPDAAPEPEADMEPEVVDLNGRLVIPGLVDAHTHVALSVIMGDEDGSMPVWNCQSKADILEHLREHVREHPMRLYYTAIFGQVEALGEETLTKEELDSIVKHRPVALIEQEGHSAWLNSGAMRMLRLNDNTPDPAPGYSYYERDADGHLTGCLKEMTMIPLLALAGSIPERKLRAGIRQITDYLLKHGVTTIYDAGIYYDEEKTYRLISKMDRAGEIPLRWEASYIITEPAKAGRAVEELKRYKKLYESEHLKFNTVKIMFDGTHRAHTARLCTPYADSEPSGCMGGTMLSEKDLYLLLSELNREGIHLHAHTVGEGASKMVLDAVDRVRQEQGELRIRVTMAHLESQRDEDIPRFAAPGIFANFTPHWHGGVDYGSMEATVKLLGEERAHHLFRVKSMIDAGAAVTFSSDEITMSLLDRWNPFLGMEIGHTRQEPKRGSDASGTDARTSPVFPPAGERLPLSDLLTGYTIQGARQMGLDGEIGSIEAGKSADFLVLDRDIFRIDPYRIHETMPLQVIIGGEAGLSSQMIENQE